MIVEGKFISKLNDAPHFDAFLEWLVQRGKLNFVEKNEVENMGKSHDAVSVENYNQFAMERGYSQVVK